MPVLKSSGFAAEDFQLAELLRKTMRSPRLDFIKWWAPPSIATPGLDGVSRQGNVVTMQDATPARLASLPTDVWSAPLIAVEFSIDFRAKELPPGTARNNFDERIFQALLRRLSPWSGPFLAPRIGLSWDEGVYLPLYRDGVFMRRTTGQLVVRGIGPRATEGRERLARLGRTAGTVYFGESNTAETSWPKSSPKVQAKLYWKVTDRNKQPMPPATWGTRIEVTCNATALHHHSGNAELRVADLASVPYRALANHYLRLTVPRLNPRLVVPRRPGRPPQEQRALQSAVHERLRSNAETDLREAVTGYNFYVPEDLRMPPKTLPRSTEVIREAADSLRRMLEPVSKR